MPPTPPQIILAVLVVLAGCLALTGSAHAGWRSRNWLYYICTAGAAAFVAGVTAQRVFPSADAVRRLGASAAAVSAPGPWDAGVSLPVTAIRLSPVAVAGLLIGAVGLSMVLLFERVSPEQGPPAPAARRFEDDDTV